MTTLADRAGIEPAASQGLPHDHRAEFGRGHGLERSLNAPIAVRTGPQSMISRVVMMGSTNSW
jgi:hypothetical protein